MNLQSKAADASNTTNPKSKFRTQVQAHSHWVNDIILAHNNDCVVSCSSDLSVKLWRPRSTTSEGPETIGHHTDYVKCLVTPRDGSAEWVASGGLDRKIRIWDLGGKGEILLIDVRDEGINQKGSVYALAHGGGILASGGPESIVRLWDPRSGKAVTKFVGHTDNIRAILVSEQGDHILSASSDTTIKLWSLTGGRCIHTLSMHSDSVWSLFSSHPRLEIFYSSDRTGLVAKTDVRNVKEIDEGLCVAVCQEKDGVHKVVSCGDYIWTTTSSSSIKRWLDVDTNAEVARAPVMCNAHATTITSTRPKGHAPHPSHGSHVSPIPLSAQTNPSIPFTSLLRLAATSPLLPSVRDPDAVTVYSVASARRASISEVLMESDHDDVVPINEEPQETVKGQDGLIKHFLLNDRRRVLTLDTAGNVIMWDLIRCIPLNSYGKRDLGDVAAEVNTVEAVANWCQVDTKTGQLTCVLEENYCFDAEVYADDIDFETGAEYREDHRINLGRWILRCLFDRLVTEELNKDEEYRQTLAEELTKKIAKRIDPPRQLSISNIVMTKETPEPPLPDGPTTPRVVNPQTPGLVIGLATPGLLFPQCPTQQQPAEGLPAVTDTDGAPSARTSLQGPPTPTLDYFSATHLSATPAIPPTPGGGGAESTPTSPTIEPGHSDGVGSGFLGKFRLGSKRSKGDSSTKHTISSGAAEEGTKTVSDTDPTGTLTAPEQVFEENLAGVIKRVRASYAEEKITPVATKITPCLPLDAPLLQLPPNTVIIIQEDKPDSGGVADLYWGTTSSVGSIADVNLLEERAPAWLGDVLLLNKLPAKESPKITFILQPWNNLLPPVGISNDGTLSRLHANRMLRAKKIVSYVGERLPPDALPAGATKGIAPGTGEGEAGTVVWVGKPEDWLELICQGQIIQPQQTLTTLRSHVWKSGGDVSLFYRRKDWKEVKERVQSESGNEREEDDKEESGSAKGVEGTGEARKSTDSNVK